MKAWSIFCFAPPQRHIARWLFAATCTAGMASAAGCADPVGDKPRAAVSAPTQGAPTDAVAVAQDAYPILGTESMIGFTGAKVTGIHEGKFPAFRGSMSVPGNDISKAQVKIEIDTGSVQSDHPKLTGHLKSADFFDVEKFPKAVFVSTQIAPQQGGNYLVTGNFTLHGVTKQISFPATIAQEGQRITTNADFGINRKDFDIVYPGRPDDLIKDEVLIRLKIVAQKPGS